MLSEQIRALETKEATLQEQIAEHEEEIKSVRAELNVVKKARKSLERYEEQLHGPTEPEASHEPDVSHEPLALSAAAE